MRYATVCSGIEAPSQAWHPLGWEPAWFSEIDRFPSAVLKHHYPEVPNLGDMTKIHENETFKKSIGSVDVFCGGTPCQSFSVAGLRKGMADPRGNLALVFLGIVDRLRPRWVVWENVPGVLSSHDGRDFGSFVGALGQLGYGWAYRVLDAQYFGVAQRRRRVFVVGHLGDWRRAAAVLFERESLSGNPPPRRGTGERTAGTLAQCSKGSGGIGYSNQELFAQNGDGLITPDDIFRNAVAFAQNTRDEVRYVNGDGQIAGALAAEAGMKQQTYVATIKGAAIGRKPENGPQYGEVLEDGTSYTLNCTERHAVCFQSKASASQSMNPSTVSPTLDKSKGDGLAVCWSIMPQNSGKDYKAKQSPVAQPLMAGGPVGGNQGGDFIQHSRIVRRLTPRECERLQGFPDNYTRIPYRKKPASECPDGPRYKALGNSMAVPVMQWIGERIESVDNNTTQ